MKNTNITLAMVAIIAAVAMLSAGLAVPIQEASASNGRGSDGGNNFEFKNKQDCEFFAGCDQTVTITSDQTIED
jgi:hypothetical protein